MLLPDKMLKRFPIYPRYRKPNQNIMLQGKWELIMMCSQQHLAWLLAQHTRGVYDMRLWVMYSLQ